MVPSPTKYCIVLNRLQKKKRKKRKARVGRGINLDDKRKDVLTRSPEALPVALGDVRQAVSLPEPWFPQWTNKKAE